MEVLVFTVIITLLIMVLLIVEKKTTPDKTTYITCDKCGKKGTCEDTMKRFLTLNFFFYQCFPKQNISYHFVFLEE